MKRIALLTSGGDAPGMNAAIRAVTRRALFHGAEVFGVRHGFAGLIRQDFMPLGPRDVGRILHLGGTILGSARCAEFQTVAGVSRALESLGKGGIEGLVVIGGNGSQNGAHELARRGWPVVGWLRPSTTISVGRTSRSDWTRRSILRSRRSIA